LDLLRKLFVALEREELGLINVLAGWETFRLAALIIKSFFLSSFVF